MSDADVRHRGRTLREDRLAPVEELLNRYEHANRRCPNPPMQSFHFDTVDSTNEAAKRMIRSGELRQPAYLLALEQTAGRGSRGRRWASPKDAGIYLSVVEFPREPFTAPKWLDSPFFST